MSTLCVDPVTGASGDMILAALFDLGADPKQVQDVVRRSGLKDVRIVFERRADRHRLVCGFCDVRTGRARKPAHGHSHGHEHSHEHHSSHRHDHDGQHREHPAHRPLSEILDLIGNSKAAARAKDRAGRIFRRLGEVEAGIHGVDIEAVQFHEVGAVDSIVDVFGACIAMEQLEVDRLYCAELKVGRGTVRCAHGTLPEPVPATAKLLEGFPFRRLDIEAELTTPTGAAILTTLSEGDWSELRFTLRRCGVGHGNRDLEQAPNILRLFLVDEPVATERAELLETDIDDESPQVLGTVGDLLREAGALDVVLVPVLMKKNRPGTRVTVTARAGDAARLAGLLFTHTSTIGVRVLPVRRYTLPRSTAEVETPWGKVKAKRIERPDGTELAPEFDSCRTLAASAGVPVRQVLRSAHRWTPTRG
ncbi:MAG: TIGR00299 family protein [Lentisphaerae bacterium RIFOXYB12_FULL_65_16]|nr:MAG: TIGR00299 family protein [Lentisphaerae bacterium RIFOXYA12_64_32]OGV85467.1 MAG: TIGR00299 family protein [Lentisphaerae bacterium RIFOXYB12_FULL_65_16]